MEIYDVLADNKSEMIDMGDEILKVIVQELTKVT